MQCNSTNKPTNDLRHPSLTIQMSNFSLNDSTCGPSSVSSPDINILVSGGHLDLSLPDRLRTVPHLSIIAGANSQTLGSSSRRILLQNEVVECVCGGEMVSLVVVMHVCAVGA
jgi:hypothetical protein